MRRTLIFLCALLPLIFSAQSRDKRSAPFTIRYNIGIPKSISSQKFRTAFNGVIESNISVNARAFGNFFVGLGYQYTHMQNNKQVFVYYQAPNTGASLSYNTRLISHCPFLRIGYDKFFERGFATFALNVGYALSHYKNVVNDTTIENRPLRPTNFSAPYLQPEVSVSFLADRSLTFSILFSYTTLFYNFDPKAPRFNGIQELSDKSNHYFISWINIGFGVTVLLGKRG